MSGSVKSEIKNCISMQISSFCVSFLEGWEIFDLFAPHWPLGCRKTGQNMLLDKNKCRNQAPHAKLRVYVKF